MSAHRQLPDAETLKNLRNQNWSYADIAEQFGVTKGAVYYQLQNAGATKKRPSHKRLIPWSVRSAHQHAHPAIMLRVLSRREAGDDTIPAVKLRMLDKWLDQLAAANVVVCYHPDTLPNDASPKGGWYYSRRRESDGQSIIRFVDPATIDAPAVPPPVAASA